MLSRSRQQSEEASGPSSPLDSIPEEILRPSRPASVVATPSVARRVSYQSASNLTPRQRETTPESRIPRVSPTGITPARPTTRPAMAGISRPPVRSTPARPGLATPSRPSQSTQGTQATQITTPMRPAQRVGGLTGLATPKAQPVTTFQEEESKERMVMTNMILENFKSYAGSVEIGPFHKSFTSIVGPNGSGKSNVIDALQFVFGFGAKAMRHDKVAHLIHNSANHPNLDFCKVELHFQYIVDGDTPDEFTIVPNSQFTMSRTVTKSGGGGYKLNGKTITHGDLRTFLKSKGVDLDQKRFLILQGEVEQIAQMKPKGQTEGETGLLEYLEDIIGTAHFKELIDVKQKDLEAANETRGQQLERVKAAEKEKAALEGKKKEAEDYLRAENELIRQKNRLYQVRKHDAQTLVDSLTQELAVIEEKLAAEKAKYKDIQTEVDEAEVSYNKLAKEYEQLGHNANEAARELQKFEKEDIRLQENRKHLKTKGKKLVKSLETDKHTLVELESTMKNCDADFAKLSAELEKLGDTKVKEETELERIRDSMKGKTEEVQVQLEQKQKELAPWTAKINDKQAEIDLAQSEYDLLSERVNSVQNKLDQAKANRVTLMESFEPKEAELAHLIKKRSKLHNQKQQIQDTMASALKDEEGLRVSAQGLRQRVDEARANKEADKSKGNVIKGLMRERDSGRLRGVLGRLGDLGIIDDKYDVAISTACPQLDQIVVEDVETAQKCIQLLREKNLGRASFIVLNKMNPVDSSVFASPEDAPRLYDLVRPKEARFATAFYFALQNTLVAKDLAQANRIAYGKQRWRVVTLDGQLIDKSGTMSGGGNRVIRGLMSSKFSNDGMSDKEIEQLEASREGEESRLRQLVAIRKEMEGEIDKIVAELPKLEHKASKLDMELKSAREQVADFDAQIADLRPDDKDVSRMSEIRMTLTKLQKDMDALRSSSRSIEVHIKELQDRILEVGGVRLRSQKAKVDSIAEQMDFVNDRLTKARVGKVSAEKNLEKTLKNCEKVENDLEDVELQLEELRKEMDAKTLVAVEVKKRLDEMNELQTDKKQQLEDLKLLVDERTEQISKFRTVEQDLKMKHGDKAKEHSHQRRNVQKYQEMLSHLRLNQYDIEDEPENEALTAFSGEELQDMNADHIHKAIEALESKLEKSQPNLGVLEEFKRCFKEYIGKVEHLKAATKTRDEIKESYDDLRKQRLDTFMSGFTAISQRLKEMYQMITLGGNAELELVDSLDPFSEGILFSVMPPKKSWKNISNLSGGEKTLSSLALVFALHHFKPTPIYVMDEIDAALDFRNVSIVANYIKERTKMAQFVIISLRNNMFELADRLVGIYKTDNTTKTIAINPTLIAQDVR